VTAPRMSRLPITVPPGYGHGSGGKRMKTLRGPDGRRDRGTAQSFSGGVANSAPARSLQRCRDVHLRGEGLMNGATIGDVQQPFPLGVVEVAD
jgi:hypothetical protein